jgi:hypothetical protein
MELIIEDKDSEEEVEVEEVEVEEVLEEVFEEEEIKAPIITETCAELKNINYKMMLMKKSKPNSATPRATQQMTNSVENLDKFLEDEKKTNVMDSWSNLDKTLKMKKLTAFGESYRLDNALNEEECVLMMKFLQESLDRKKLQRVKDVIYDKTTGMIKSIPALTYNKATSHFTLKNMDKRVSTLKSLPPKRNRGTVKNEC